MEVGRATVLSTLGISNYFDNPINSILSTARYKVNPQKRAAPEDDFHLAADIQEALLFLPRITAGKDPMMERELRAVVAAADWQSQRETWRELRAG